MRKLEENTDDLGFKFKILSVYSELDEDSYAEGELDFYEDSNDPYGMEGEIYTLDELLKELKDNGWYAEPKNYAINSEAGDNCQIESDRTVTKDDKMPTKAEFARWEKGKMKLYNEHLTIVASIERGDDKLTDADIEALRAKGFD